MTKNDRYTRRDALKVGGAAALMTGLSPSQLLAEGNKAAQVPQKMLGKTKRQIPILVFGAGQNLDTRFDPKLAEAVRYGVTYFDTADCYSGGTSETAVGNFLERTKMRDKCWITSKSDAHDPEGLERTLDEGLVKLKTNHVDLYYMHALKDGDLLNPAMAKKADELKKKGKVKAFGFSCHSGNVVELMNKAATLPWIDSIMFRYNFRKYGDKELNKAIDACAKADIGLIAMKTQGSEASFADAWKKFETSGKFTKHQAVLKAVWGDARITAAVSHMDTFEKLRENIAAALDKSKLGLLDQQALERYAQATRAHACDGCDHLCNPAVEGDVAIGDTMRALMYNDVYGDADKALTTFRRLPIAAQDLDRDFARANAACPHGVDVAAHMKRAREIFNERRSV